MTNKMKVEEIRIIKIDILKTYLLDLEIFPLILDKLFIILFFFQISTASEIRFFDIHLNTQFPHNIYLLMPFKLDRTQKHDIM